MVYISVFSVLLSVFLFFSAKFSVLITRVQEAKRIFHRGWKRLGYVARLTRSSFQAGHGSSRFLL